MPLGILPALLALAIVATFAGAYYLLLNARSVAALFSRPDNELAPGRGGRARPPRGRLVAAIALFIGGTIASLMLWSFAGTDAAIDAVESHPEEVERR